MSETDRTEARFRATLGQMAGQAGVRALDERLGVAVSGGGDSMALLAMASRAGHALHAVTIDHGLRREAADEAGLVARYCRDIGLPHDILRLSDLDHGPGLAARAREARYDALVTWARESGIDTVLLGHTRDDQAETLLMRLARGSGTDGLAAMAPARLWRGIRWLRPLLDIERRELRNWLRAADIAWAEDPTNDDPAYDRVRIRLALDDLGTLGLTRKRLAGTARVMARQRTVLEAAGAALARQAMRPGPLGEVYLDPAALVAAHVDSALRVLSEALMTVSGAPYRPRLAALEDALNRITGPDFHGMTLSGCRLTPLVTEIVVSRESVAIGPAPLGPGRRSWDARWEIDNPARADFWIAPLGEDGLQRATTLMRRAGLAPPEVWVTAPRPALQAVPAIYRAPGVRPQDLAAVPSAGLVVDRGAAGISVTAPGAARVRHCEPE